MIDLRRAIIFHTCKISFPEMKAVNMLREEITKRTRLILPVSTELPEEHIPLIVVASKENCPPFAKPFLDLLPPLSSEEPTSREGYLLKVDKSQANRPLILAIGNTPRATLFAVGRLLRCLRMERDHLSILQNLFISSKPAYPLRGHQLGYRPKTHSYDGWDLAMWEQYLRDLVAFGTNAIELIPPRSDDAPDSPLFPLPPLLMMCKMSRLADEYDLDVWIWYPAIDEDYSDKETIAFALKEWAEVFKTIPRIDAVFVPGGDPGHTPPKVLFSFLEKQADNLRRYHPNAQMWVSPQGFSADWTEEFLYLLRKEPEWLNGIVFGPQVRLSLPRLRELVPQRYPIRLYPDITHSRQCQFPVPNWDMANAFTQGREGINPRPIQMSQIAKRYLPYSIGFITYSEGCNDDVNKVIWSALGWDPEAEPLQILREYAGYFMGEEFREAFAQGLLSLEKNWDGPLLLNDSVPTTFLQFQELERSAPPSVKLNWRFQMALYRAYYDAYIQARLRYETHLEERAIEELRQAKLYGSLLAMERAEEILDKAISERVAKDIRARIFELAEALFQSVRMQLSVERYYAIEVGRGANLDTIDFPLNNRLWLKSQFSQIRSLQNEGERLKRIEEILNWKNPGPGGFYLDLGSSFSLSYAVGGKPYEEDPEFRESPLIGFAYHPNKPTSWWTHLESRYDAPLKLRIQGLDPNSSYKLRVVYAGDRVIKIRLVANEEFEVHPFILKPYPPSPLEFEIPKWVIKSGELLLCWFPEPGLGGNGRGCQVAEIWLIREEDR